MNNTTSSYDAVETAIDLVKADRSSKWVDIEKKSNRRIPSWTQSTSRRKKVPKKNIRQRGIPTDPK